MSGPRATPGALSRDAYFAALAALNRGAADATWQDVDRRRLDALKEAIRFIEATGFQEEKS